MAVGEVRTGVAHPAKVGARSGDTAAARNPSADEYDDVLLRAKAGKGRASAITMALVRTMLAMSGFRTWRGLGRIR